MDFLEKIHLVTGRAGGFLNGVFQAAKRKIHDFFPDKRHRIYVYGGGGVLVFLIFLMVMLSGNSGRQESPALPERPRASIPAQEIFLPDEPDFVPGVLLERERRLSWSEEDAAQYWQDPLKYGEEQWREKIEAVIDDYMERVP